MGKRSKCNKSTDEGTVNKSSSKTIDKKIKLEECEASDTIAPTASSSKETKDKTKKQKTKSLANEKIFEDDVGSIETQSESSKKSKDEVIDAPNDAKKKKKNKALSQNDEEEVKEADIDQFCDELTEEDNVQYENWVELIEAKLHSNTKKPN